MELSEVVGMSLVSTAMVVAVYVLRARYTRRVKICGPFAYQLNGSGVPKEIPAGSIPGGVVNGLRGRILARFYRPKAIMLGKPMFMVFALTIFLVQVIIMLTITQ